MKLRLLAAICVILVGLAGCTARYKLNSSLTENGFLASRNIPVGTVYLWPQGSSRLQRVGEVGISEFRHPQRAARNASVSFSTSAEYAGGARLTEQQKIDAGVEIQNKSSLQTQNEVLSGYTAPRNALIAAVRGEPDFWHTGLEVENGVPENAPRVVFVYEVVEGDKIELEIEGVSSASAEFPLDGIAGSNVKFKVINAGQLKIESTVQGTRVPLYSRVAVFDMVDGPNGPAFPRVQEDVLRELARVLAAGT